MHSHILNKKNLINSGVFVFALALAMYPDAAFAQAAGGGASLSSFLSNVVNIITGPTGQALAVIAIALCGVSTMFGAMSMRNAGFGVLGIAILFSAAWIVAQITGGAA